ncbi:MULTISPECIES: helix-turn-helix transcriptional regulator [Enterococcus]|uniref:Transcriptional regulator n=1 Tax=Enterococcus xiangfangensis TaxID=1296537 RepID=A0ABU3FB25_9ENTE|nr:MULTISPECIES: helix-turn-helix domain-containing protein [Enterococcus]MDT2759848.1 transcriptional regulator [Enterococcus xiangfangensis]
MYEKVSGYRKLIGLTQKEMANDLNISVQSYRNKERGRSSFSDNEKMIFKNIVNKKMPNVTIDEIFFTSWVSQS